jgi:glucose-1-phosphate thymidylyltransferase
MVLTHEDRTAVRLKETCVVLAGGAGRRLGHITAGGNKHLVEIGGRPALGHVLDTVLATGSVKKLVVVTTPDSLPDVEELVACAGGQVQVVVRAQARPTGTLDAVLTALPYIEHDAFSVHYGDNLFGWRRLPSLGPALPGRTSACLFTVPPPPDWRRYAAVITAHETDGRLVATGLQEKPTGEQPAKGLRSLTGFFRFDTHAFRREAPLVPISPRGEFELTDVVRRLLVVGQVRVIPVELPWIDFGTESGFLQAPAVIGARGLTGA